MLEKALGLALDVVELPGMYGPAEDRHDRQDEHCRQWDQQVEDVHGARVVNPQHPARPAAH